MRAPVEIIEDVPQILGRIAYFQGMSQESLDRLGQNSHVINLRRSDVLVSKGAIEGRNVYAVLDGQIHLGLPMADSVRSLRFVETGMTLGESILLMQVPPPYQAVATRKSRVLVIDGDRWLHEIQSIPEMTWEVLKHLAQRRLHAMNVLTASSHRTNLSRVVAYIMKFQPKLQSDCFSFELPARKLDIAASLGMSNASFSRALQRLKQDNLIQVSGLFIHVLNAAGLNQAAEDQ